MGLFGKKLKRQLAGPQPPAAPGQGAYDPIGEANSYKAALERAAYGDAGQQYGQGLGQISNYLAGAGPMADSGGATALRSRLASQIYGSAQGRIGNAYANMLGQNFAARRNAYFQQILNQQQRPKKKKFLDYLGGAIGGGLGFLAGGPAGAAAGYGVGSSIGGGGGGGGQQASDAYYG